MPANAAEINVVHKLIQKIRFGLIGLMVRDRLLGWDIDISPYYWVQEDAPDSPAPEITGDFSAYTFSFFGPGEMERIGSRPTYRDIPVEEMKARLAKGQLCYGAIKGGEPAAFAWIALDECDNRLHPYKLKPNEAYFYDSYTMKPFRGHNLTPYLRKLAYGELRRMGRDTFYSLHITLNRSSTAFKKKLNAKFLEHGLYICLFSRWRWTLRKKRIVSRLA